CRSWIRFSFLVIVKPSQGQHVDVGRFKSAIEIQLNDVETAADAGQFLHDRHVEQGEERAAEGGLADELDLLGVETGQQSASGRAVDTHFRAATAGQIKGLGLAGLEVEAVQQRGDAGGEGGFGLQQGGDVGLADENVA